MKFNELLLKKGAYAHCGLIWDNRDCSIIVECIKDFPDFDITNNYSEYIIVMPNSDGCYYNIIPHLLTNSWSNIICYTQDKN